MLKCVVGWDDLSVLRFNQTHDQCKVWANLFPHSIQGEHSAARCVVLSLPGICHIISRNWVWIWALTVNLCCDQTWLLIRSRRVIDNFRQMNSEDSPRWVTTAKKSHLNHHSVFVKPHDFLLSWSGLRAVTLAWGLKKGDRSRQVLPNSQHVGLSLGDNEWGSLW